MGGVSSPAASADGELAPPPTVAEVTDLSSSDSDDEKTEEEWEKAFLAANTVGWDPHGHMGEPEPEMQPEAGVEPEPEPEPEA